MALGLIQGGKVVFADGFGVCDLDGHSKPDADTLFMIASDSKALTTLMLAKLVDEKKLAWDTPYDEAMRNTCVVARSELHRVEIRHEKWREGNPW